MPEIKTVNDTTFEVTLVGGDKVEIGDKDSTDFKPYIKLNRWDGECFIAIKPANLVEEEVEYEVEGDKVKCKYKVKYGDDTEEEFEAEFYPLEPRTVIAKDKEGNDVEFTQCELGGFEFEVILKKKPLANKIVLDIESQGLKFYPQPYEIPEDSIAPENVLGSIAVYHATRGNMHKGRATAEKYKCGKAFHIYRPKITDAEGNWVWGELNLDEGAGTLTTVIPQSFLDNAVYPVSTGTTNFGEEGAGSTQLGYSLDAHYFVRGVPSGSGTALLITAYLPAFNAGFTGNAQTAIYNTEWVGEPDNYYKAYQNLAVSDVAVTVYPDDWVEFDLSGINQIDIIADVNYALGCSTENYTYLWYDLAPSEKWSTAGWVGDDLYENWFDYSSGGTGDSNNTLHSVRLFGIYCTYGEEVAVDPPTVTTQAVTSIGFD